MSKVSSPIYETEFNQTSGVMSMGKGEYLVARKRLQKNGEDYSYVMLMQRFFLVGKEIKSRQAIELRDLLLELLVLQDARKVMRVYVSSEDLMKTMDISQSGLSRCMTMLIKVGFIIHKSKGVIDINPECVWRGSLHDWQEACEAKRGEAAKRSGAGRSCEASSSMI